MVLLRGACALRFGFWLCVFLVVLQSFLLLLLGRCSVGVSWSLVRQAGSVLISPGRHSGVVLSGRAGFC